MNAIIFVYFFIKFKCRIQKRPKYLTLVTCSFENRIQKELRRGQNSYMHLATEIAVLYPHLLVAKL